MARLMSLRPPALLISVALLSATVGVAAVWAAQGDEDPPTSSSTTTTQEDRQSPPWPGPSTSTSAPPATTTTAQAPPGGQGDPPDSDGPPADGPQGDGEDSMTTPHVVPPEYRSRVAAIKRTKPNDTRRLLEAVRPLVDLGLTEEAAAVMGFGQFPIAGYATFTDDWWFPRLNPTFHLHEGTDVFAAMGTPVRSPAAGVLRRTTGPVGGLAVYVEAGNGTEYYMAHLSAFADAADGVRVVVGQVIGFVGNSGNAAGGATHVHFEVHPNGRDPVPPKPFLDRWIDEAIANAPALVASLESSRPRAVRATGLTRHLFDDVGGAHAAPPRAQLLWAGAASPAGGALRIAAKEVDVISHTVDWTRREAEHRRLVAAWSEADRRARTMLTPLTPPPLHAVLGYSL